MKTRICIIGCGNISNSRHIPAINTISEAEIVGLISDNSERISKTIDQHKKLKGVNTLHLDVNKDVEEQMEKCEWFMNSVDAVVIGTPPRKHFPMVKACLKLKKHVLVEKPMMMTPAECDEVIGISKENGVVLNVMHSFQFSNGMMKLKALYESGQLGELKSILELQLSNRDRRLPVWYDELPLGLFYDEAAHFFYSAAKFGGELTVLNSHAVFNEQGNTPRFLEAQMLSGDIPVQMFMNFDSPICEWGFILICDKKIAVYDYFKDILVVMKNDGEHYAGDILRTSMTFSGGFWKGFIANGFRLVSKKLYYGHNVCIKKFLNAIETGESAYELSAELGKKVVIAMNEVAEGAKR